MRTKTLLASASTPAEVKNALTTARTRNGWTEDLIAKYAGPAVRKAMRVRPIAKALLTVVPPRTVAIEAPAPAKPAPRRTIAAGRKLSARDQARLKLAAQHPVGTYTGAELYSVGEQGSLSLGNARVTVDAIGPAGGLIVEVLNRHVTGYARLSPESFGELRAKGGTFTVWLSNSRNDLRRLGQYRLTKPVA